MTAEEYRTASKRRPRTRTWRVEHADTREKVLTTSFEVPLCPSVNAMYANVAGKGRVKTKAYKLWRANALREMLCQSVKPVLWPVSVSITLPESMRGDASNRIKAAEDLAVCAEIIPDDSKKYVRPHTTNFAPIENMIVVIASIGGMA